MNDDTPKPERTWEEEHSLDAPVEQRHRDLYNRMRAGCAGRPPATQLLANFERDRTATLADRLAAVEQERDTLRQELQDARRHLLAAVRSAELFAREPIDWTNSMQDQIALARAAQAQEEE